MALFGRTSMHEIVAKGAPAIGVIRGIHVSHVAEGESTRRIDEYAVEHPGGTFGIRQVLRPDDVVRLGMEVDAIVLGEAGVIDWAATGRRLGFDGALDDHRSKVLKRPPVPGIVDEDPGPARARKRGEAATIEVTGLHERSHLGGLAVRLTATVTVSIPGTAPYEAEIKGLIVPFYASHLIEVGATLPGYVDLRRLDKPVVDWAAAAMADPGIGRPPARPRTEAATEAMGTPGAPPAPVDVEQSIADAAQRGDTHGGIDLATYVAVEVGLQRDRVRPDEYEAYAATKGVPMGTWASASAAWQAAIRADWQLGAAFGTAFEAERKRR